MKLILIIVSTFLLSSCGLVSEEKYEQLQSENSNLRLQITRLDGENSQLIDENAELETDRDDAQRSYEDAVYDANNKINNLNSQIEDTQRAGRFGDYDTMQYKIRNMDTETEIE